jgi:hypothetical protein
MTDTVKKTFTERATSFILVAVSTVGAFLVGEQLISGEQLAEVQGIIGMALSGGGSLALTALYVLRTLLPKKVALNLVDSVGQDKIDKFFVGLEELHQKINSLTESNIQLNSKVDKLIEEKEQLKTELGL